MNGHVDPERRLRCLSLGTYALAVVDRLRQNPSSRSNDLPDLINDTLTAIDEIDSNGWATTSASGLRPYRYDDQVDILSAVKQKFQIPSDELKTIKNNPKTSDSEVLKKAIQFFHELAREALLQSHRSSEEVLLGLRR